MPQSKLENGTNATGPVVAVRYDNQGRGPILLSIEDAALFDAHTWYTYRDGDSNRAYVRTTVREGGKSRGKLLHRLIRPDIQTPHIDHINGDGLDNRRENLRPATRSQNMQNRTKRAAASSRYKGVHKIKHSKPWRAMIKFEGKRVSLGCFSTENEAAEAYNKRAVALFGEYANLNKIEVP